MGRIKSVAIVGTGQTGHQFAHHTMSELKKPVAKVWGINRVPLYLKHVDMGIAMDDHIWMNKKANFPGVREALLKLDTPIMTTTSYGQKNYVEYPLKRVLKAIPYFQGRFLDNSINYALALAITQKIKHIYLWGCDFQKPDSIDCEIDRRETIPTWRTYYKDEFMAGDCEPGGRWIYFLMAVAYERKLIIHLPHYGTLAGMHREKFFYGFLEQPEI